jgi:hypothetical protein
LLSAFKKNQTTFQLESLIEDMTKSKGCYLIDKAKEIDLKSNSTTIHIVKNYSILQLLKNLTIDLTKLLVINKG